MVISLEVILSVKVACPLYVLLPSNWFVALEIQKLLKIAVLLKLTNPSTLEVPFTLKPLFNETSPPTVKPLLIETSFTKAVTELSDILYNLYKQFIIENNNKMQIN